MKRLITTTAMVIALSLPVAVFAQSDSTVNTQAFINARGMNQMLATDLIGHDVYARRMPVEAGAGNAATDGNMAAMTTEELNNMDNVGQINDFVIGNDGRVVAVVIGIGGFLGAGDQDVAVSMDQVSFAANPDDPQDVYIVLNTSGEMLKTSPKFDPEATAADAAATGAATNDTAATDGTTTTNDTAATDGTTTTNDTAATDGTTTTNDPAATDGTTTTNDTTATDGTTTTNDPAAGNDTAATQNRTRLTPPTMDREGYNTVKQSDVSIDTLIGKTVYGTDDTNVGTVSDVKADANGAIQDVIIDFGGFLGLGTTQVALGYDELTILTDAGNEDLRVYVDATKDQIRQMPVYEEDN